MTITPIIFHEVFIDENRIRWLLKLRGIRNKKKTWIAVFQPPIEMTGKAISDQLGKHGEIISEVLREKVHSTNPFLISLETETN